MLQHSLRGAALLVALALPAVPAAAQSVAVRSGACALSQVRERLVPAQPRRGALTTKDCVSTQYGSSQFEDVYRFDLTAPTPVGVALVSGPGTLEVGIHDASYDRIGGTFVGCRRQKGRHEPLCDGGSAFMDTLKPGTYYAVVSRHRYSSQATAPASAPARDLAAYELLLTTAPCTPVPDGALGIGETRAGRLTQGGCLSAKASYTAIHELTVTRQQDVAVSVRATGFAPAFELRRPGSGHTLGTSRPVAAADGEASASVKLDPGTYHMAVGSRAPLDTGRYELAVRFRGADGELAAAAQCRPGAAREAVAPGQPRDGALTTESCWEGEVGGRRGAYYRLDLRAPQLVELSLASSAFEPRLFLHDASGRALPYGMSMAAGSVSIRETLPAGTYYVFVTSRATNATGGYRLEVK